MMGFLKHYCFYIIVLIVIGLIIWFAGCQGGNMTNGQPVPDSPIRTITKVVHSTNWLAIVGFLMITWGVMSIFNGNTKNAQFIAGGVTLLGLVSTYAVFNELLVRWLPVLQWGIPIGAVTTLGLFIYNHRKRSQKIVNGEFAVGVVKYMLEVFDKDKDGKVTVDEIKAVLCSSGIFKGQK